MKTLINFFTKMSTVELIMMLRGLSIILQVFLLLFVNLALNYQLPWLPMFIIIVLELVFNIASFSITRHVHRSKKNHVLIQLLADVFFLGCLLYFSGGATNAFVSLLLVPIAIAAITLPLWRGLIIASSAIAIYSVLLWTMPMHVMHGNMAGHFIGMWINFLFSALVLSLIVGYLARAITRREITIAKFREQQLKKERIIALGVASAQVTHNLATPLATLQLLSEELSEQAEGPSDLLNDIEQQVNRCAESLRAFRVTTEQIKTNEKQPISCADIHQQIKHHCQLTYPEVSFKFIDKAIDARIEIDGSFIPAVVNVIDNAVHASQESQNKTIEIEAYLHDQQWCLSIKDFGKGFVIEQLHELGDFPQLSEHGFGVSIMLSNASLERLEGRLWLDNHQTGGAVVLITMPIIVN